MARVKIADAGGDTMTFVKIPEMEQYFGVVMENMDAKGIRNLPIRDDDVILCSYPRSGCHWLWEQMRMIQTGKPEVDDLDKDAAMFENISHGEMDDAASPRVLNTHLWFTQFPAEVTTKKTKLVLLYRNPKDVFNRGSYSVYLKKWEQMMEQHPDHPIHLITFEDLKKNPIEELSKLSKFLGKDYDVSFLQAVSDACALDKMRSKKAAGRIWQERVADNQKFMQSFYRQ
ncbi:hypothetical protein BaRGS_00002777, partial [Batillaria attramentaria]